MDTGVRLPEEIIEIIFSYLPDNTLVQCLLLSHRYFTIAGRILYHNLHVQITNPSLQLHFTDIPRIQNITLDLHSSPCTSSPAQYHESFKGQLVRYTKHLSVTYIEHTCISCSSLSSNTFPGLQTLKIKGYHPDYWAFGAKSLDTCKLPDFGVKRLFIGMPVHATEMPKGEASKGILPSVESDFGASTMMAKVVGKV